MKYKRMLAFYVLLPVFLMSSWNAAYASGQEKWQNDYKKAIQLFNAESYEEALTLTETALSRRLELNKKKQDEILKLRNLRGILQLHLGRDALAEDSFAAVLSELEKQKKMKSKIYAMTLENLGSLYLLQNYPDMAEDNYRRALKILKEVLGEGHIRNAVTYNSLGLLALQRKNYEKAESYLRQSEGIFKNSKTYFPRERAVMFHNLAELYFALKDDEKSQKFARRALKLQQDTSGRGARRRLATMKLLKNIYDRTGQDEAAEKMQQGIEEAKDVIPPKASEFVTDLLIWKIEKN